MNLIIPPICYVCRNRTWNVDPETTRVIRSIFEPGQVLRCQRCGTGILFPQPPLDVVESVYASPEYMESYDRAGEAFVLSRETFQQQLVPRFERIEEYVPGRGKILDVGASRGYFLAAAKERNWIPYGVEAGEAAIQIANSQFGLQIEHGTIESVSIPDEFFDCIHLSHVLEHVADPVACIQKLVSALKPGGVLVVEVPYEFGDFFDRVRSLMLRAQRTPYPVRSSHLHFFTSSTLPRLISQCGLKPVFISTPRRNRSLESRLPFGRFFKSWVYRLESFFHLGPLIEVYAQKPTL